MHSDFECHTNENKIKGKKAIEEECRSICIAMLHELTEREDKSERYANREATNANTSVEQRQQMQRHIISANKQQSEKK